MSIEIVLEGFKSSPSVARNVTTWRHLPARKELYVDFSPHLHPKLAEALRKRGIERLYSHQATALALLREGKNIVVVTPTASGKTLCYNLPVLQTMLEQPQSRALYLFPTKALSQDQLAELRQFSQILPRSIKAFTYDGDTPPDLRRAIREEGEVVITNPDMLHTGILPHHTAWIKFFSALKYVVIDEIHYYRGVFGSHLTNLIRRLKRVCRHYGSQSQYICSSATIANPMELASCLVEEEIELVDNNGAPSSEKHFIFFNPPIVDKSLGIRSSYIAAARKLSLSFLEKSIPTIVFATSRL
ncbi:MAG: DEAD/DEAH box helicase, partial [Acidobacteriota bacterium]